MHATHLTDDDIELLGDHAAPTSASARPPSATSADGIGPAARLHDAGCRLTLGSDSHAVIDPFEEMRAARDGRAAGHARSAATGPPPSCCDRRRPGTRRLGFADAGAIAVGQRADLVTLDTASPRTAGTGADEHTAVFAATAADVVQVVVDGRVVVHAAATSEEIGRELDDGDRSAVAMSSP